MATIQNMHTMLSSVNPQIEEFQIMHERRLSSQRNSQILPVNDFLTDKNMNRNQLISIEEFQETDDAQTETEKENGADLLRKMIEPLHDDLELWGQKQDSTKAIKLMLKQKEIAMNQLRKQLIQSIPDNNAINLSLCTDIECCPALKRMVMLLKNYQDYDDNLVKILTEIESQHTPFVLDLYHHIMNHHVQSQDIDILSVLYQQSVSGMYSLCNLNICSKFRRHAERERIMYPQYRDDQSNIMDAHTQYYVDLMDMIHCNILHSYDTGMRVNNEAKTTDKIHPKTLTLGTVNNKYYTEFTHTKQKQSTTSFDFGHRYYYWDVYRDNDYYDSGANAGYKKGDWYIEQKYDDLQEEVLENEIHTLGKRQFERALKKAEKYLDCAMSREMRSDSVELSEYCQIRPGTVIRKENLLAIILYSDYSILCTHFSGTFRKYTDETLMEMKDRNSEYWNWSKLLVETVELYGTNICNSNIDIFYHGVSYMTFASFLSYFCGPTSCTPQIDVAHNFCGSNGLILELVKENNFSLLKYFNVQWISSFTNEDERLFIGGNKPLKFHSIRLLRENANYYIYIVALTLLDYILSGKRLTQSDIDNKIYNKTHAIIINKLLKHHDPTTEYKNKLHSYINDTFVTLIQNRKHISIHLNAVNTDYPFIRQNIPYIFHKKIKNLLLFHQIAKVFKNCETLTVWSDQNVKDGNVLTKAYLDELRAILSELNYLNNTLSLKTIQLNDVRYYNGNKLKFLDNIQFKQKYALQFPFCRIKVETKTRFIKKRKSIIRSDLIIDRSMTLLHKAQELSHAASAMHRQWSGNSQSGSAGSSRRPSATATYNPSMTIKTAPTTPSTVAGLTPISTHLRNISASNAGFPGIDMNKVKVAMALDSIHEASRLSNTIVSQDLQQLDDELTSIEPLKTRYSHIIITKKASLTSLWDDEALMIWNSLCLEKRNNATLEDLYSSLIQHFKKVTLCEYRSPTMHQLTPFFMYFAQSKSNTETSSIHLNQFERFYSWFHSMCLIISDLKHIYDKNEDVLCSLFYNRSIARQILQKQPRGTFLLRIGDHMNKLYVSCKEKKKHPRHYALTRTETEFYRIGESNEEKNIFSYIKYNKQLKYLYSPNSLLDKKIYF